MTGSMPGTSWFSNFDYSGVESGTEAVYSTLVSDVTGQRQVLSEVLSRMKRQFVPQSVTVQNEQLRGKCQGPVLAGC
ncbi:hypothetical protein [Noviherbaspirillum sp.]|uniref:hypothetical protein n=1 Tax=Noviherbaspirillum sp. TaxID=1926288 RepID=UPI002D78EF25|nr:hypothetical protein [Noviherbaspirillum sp.]